ncbi:kyphoscoliosis peptidase-like [Saccostrea echinata]|uniref:kyphoscoliosis peptidase-like n=1 Tax=Saccostrea echinata TaxID=191078 RepID=UPI002A81970A|nr:kyphoscoliosis peptidase-like [Saccostrea echinata]
MVRQILLVLSVVGATLAADPTPCCVHHQFTADLLEVGGKIDPKTGAPEPITIQSKLYYDYDAKKQRVDRVVENDDGTTYNLTVYVDYKEQLARSLVSGTCYVTHLHNQPMQEPCVPATSSFVESRILGPASNGIRVNSFVADLTKAANTTMKISVTEDDCTPISASSYGVIEGAIEEITYFFTNLDYSLPHHVFHIPAACHGVHVSLPRHVSHLSSVDVIIMGSASSKRIHPSHTGLNGDCPRAELEDKFANVDDHARKAPKTLMMSDNDLAAYLCEGTSDDVNKIRAFYMWIVTNKAQLQALSKDEKTQHEVLTKRFDSLTRIADIESKIVKGLYKAPTDQLNANTNIHGDHSWNVVNLAGKWHVVDCQCGSSDILLESFYFLPDPQQFISNHFPLDIDRSWQLLTEPISLEDFNQAPVVSETAIARGVRVVFPKTRIVNVRHSFHVSVDDTQAVLSDFAAVLSSEDGLAHNEFVLISRCGSHSYFVNIRPPFVGNFRLTILGKLSSTRMEAITEFLVTCSSVKKHLRKFPKEYQTWGIEPRFPEFTGEMCTIPPALQEVKDGSLDLSISTRTMLDVYASLRWLEDGRNFDDYMGTDSSLSEIKLKSLLPKKGFYRVCLYLRRGDVLYPVLYLLLENKKGVQSTPPHLSEINKDILI